jgi:hypothetical protein
MSNEIRAAIRPVKARVEDELIARPGVNAVDIAEKVTGGQPTGELSIVVYVDKKVPPSRVTKANAIPAEIDGIKTDVQEMTVELQSPRWEPLDVGAQVDATTYPTLVGGISMGPSKSFYLTPPEVPTAGNYVMVGTLGALVKDNATGATMALSNFHVAAVDTNWSTSDRQCQPGRVDGGNPPGDEFGTLARAVISDYVDGSVTTLDSGKQWKAEVQGIGAVAGTAAAVLNQPVRKRGRTTELTYGTIASLDFTVSIDYGDGVGTRTLKNQLRIATDTTQSARFSDHGDSGSVIMTDDRHVVGLLFAGSSDGANTFANPIDMVLDELDVTLLTGGLTLVTKGVICKPSLITICPSKAVICFSKQVICQPSVITICYSQQIICKTNPILCNHITQTPICVVSGPVCGGPPGGPVEGPIEQPGFQGGEQVDYGYGEADVYSAGYAEGYAAASESSATTAQGVGDRFSPNLSYAVCPSVSYCPSFAICPSRACPSVLYCPSLACPSRFCPTLACPTLACPSLACPSLACNPGGPGGIGGGQGGAMDASFWAGYLAALEQQGNQGTTE